MSDTQLAFIEHCATNAPRQRFLEVGVYFGLSTTLMAQYGLVVAVDWFRGNPEGGADCEHNDGEAEDRLRGYLTTLALSGAGESILTLSGKSDDVLPLLREERFGVVLIDANHAEDFCYRDICNTWKQLLPGGWLLLDDYSVVMCATSPSGTDNTVQRAWERFAREHGLEGLPLYTADSEETMYALPSGEARKGPKLVAVQKPL